MAYRMQSSAPELIDLAGETKQTLAMYGAQPGKVILPLRPRGIGQYYAAHNRGRRNRRVRCFNS